MTGQEIRDLINENNLKIEQILSVTSFVLNKEVHRLIGENKALADLCINHEDDGTGLCKYCLKQI
jgi:hypothetical protein